MTTSEQPDYIVMCEDHNIPLLKGNMGDGYCPQCQYCPDMQSTYLLPLTAQMPYTPLVFGKIFHFLQDLLEESNRAEKEHRPFASVHEAAGILFEEVDEFWEEVKKKSSARDLENMRKELVQIASICYRTVKYFCESVKTS